MKPEALTAYAREYVVSPFVKVRVSVAGAKLLAHATGTRQSH